ncbi:hypothetical protein [Streptomyces sp. A0592]|nr:hypothetical protein [Streptomyces sp. A0592]
MTVVAAMSVEGHAGMQQEGRGRVQVLIPLDFRRRVRDLVADHSES